MLNLGSRKVITLRRCLVVEVMWLLSQEGILGARRDARKGPLRRAPFLRFWWTDLPNWARRAKTCPLPPQAHGEPAPSSAQQHSTTREGVSVGRSPLRARADRACSALRVGQSPEKGSPRHPSPKGSTSERP